MMAENFTGQRPQPSEKDSSAQGEPGYGVGVVEQFRQRIPALWTEIAEGEDPSGSHPVGRIVHTPEGDQSPQRDRDSTGKPRDTLVWTAKDSPQIVGVVTPVLRQGLQSQRPLELGERFGLELPFVTQAGHNGGQIILYALWL